MGEAVIGPAKEGGTARGMPVEIGGKDGTGLLRTLRLTANGNISLGGATVEIGEVQLLGADGVTLGVVNADGSLVVASGLIPRSYDYISYTATSGTVDTYVYKQGGSGGTTVATLTVTWTNSSKSVLSSVART